MDPVVKKLQYWLNEVPLKFHNLEESQLAFRPAPDKWSKKEILGHLCDSATNNHHRFLRVQYEAQPFSVIGYNQDQWVSKQGYQDQESEQILAMWVALNQQLCRVITRMAPEQHQLFCQLTDGQTVTLQWLIQDYLDHLEHHIKQIF